MRRRLLIALVSVALFGGSTVGGVGVVSAAAAADPGPSGPTDLALSQIEQANAAKLPALQAALGDAYGGAWFDGAGVLRVGVVGPASVTAPPGVQLEQVTVPAAALAALRDRVAGDLMSGALADLSAASVRASAADQTVVVGVISNAAAAASALRLRYGPGVVAETIAAPTLAERDCSKLVEALLAPKACDAAQNLRSGLQISSPQGNVTVLCSSAFGVHVGPYKGVMTAGHCQETSTSSSWAIGVGGSAFGVSGRKTFTNGTRADSLVITVPTNRGGPRDCVYETESLCRTVAGYAAGVVAGQTVCKSGYRTEVSCGKVVAPDTTVTYQAEHVTINHIAAACSRVNSGDSGSGVYQVLPSGAAIAEGILSGSTTSTACPAITDLSGDSNLMFFSTWRLSMSTSVGFPLRNGYRESGDFNGDVCGDVLAVYRGFLYLYPGGCNADFAGTGQLIGSGWNDIDTILRPGDFDGDGCADIVGRTPAGDLLFYGGDCAGGFRNGGGKVIGVGWNAFDTMLTPGDFDGDGCPDLIGRTPTGDLLFYGGDCAGGFRNGAGRVVGTGFQYADMLVTPGDWTGDGCVDLLARFGDGSLRTYYGSCAGGFVGNSAPLPGWSALSDLLGVGDWTGDGCSDLVARFPDGRLRWYAGDCAGGFAGQADFNSGWQVFSALR